MGNRELGTCDRKQGMVINEWGIENMADDRINTVLLLLLTVRVK